MNEKITVLIQTANLFQECLKELLKRTTSILDENKISYKLIIVNSKYPHWSHAKTVNSVAKELKSKYFFLINDDIFILQNPFSPVLEMLEEDAKIGIIGYRMCQLNLIKSIFDIQLSHCIHAGGFFSKDLIGHYYQPSREEFMECDWVTFAFVCIRTKLFKEIGLLDENFQLFEDDVDFCLRARKKGYKVLCFQKNYISHIGGNSLKQLIPSKDYEKMKDKDRKYLLEKWLK